MRLSDLIQDARNANRGTDRGRSAVRKSLKDLGAGRSIVLDKHGRIIAGNKTAEAAGKAGFDSVVVVRTDGTRLVAVQRTDLDLETDSKAKLLAVADNRTAELGLDWDEDVIKAISAEVDLSGLFDDDELAKFIGDAGADLLTDDDDVPEAPKVAVTKPGDLYELGEHRLLCGDATNSVDIKRVMGGGSADLVWTDPPYNVAYTGKTKDALKIENDSMDAEQFRDFLRAAFVAVFDTTAPGGGIYIAHADLEGENFRGAMREAGWMVKQCLVWVKNSMVLGRQDYQCKHEPILYGWKPGAAHHWHGDRCQTTVLEFDRPSRSAEHPTMKPAALVEYCIRNSSKVGEVVLDPFGGSGTTLIACEATGRKARLVELDPIYCDVIYARWEAATGRKAKRL